MLQASKNKVVEDYSVAPRPIAEICRGSIPIDMDCMFDDITGCLITCITCSFVLDTLSKSLSVS